MKIKSNQAKEKSENAKNIDQDKTKKTESYNFEKKHLLRKVYHPFSKSYFLGCRLIDGYIFDQ